MQTVLNVLGALLMVVLIVLVVSVLFFGVKPINVVVSMPEQPAPVVNVNAPPALQPQATDYGQISPKGAKPVALKQYPGAVNISVPALGWTGWTMNNLVIPGAVQVRPWKPYEATFSVSADKYYQLKTDYDDSNPNWRPGSLIYKFRVPRNFQPVLVGSQGDTAIMLCWGPEQDSNLVWMKTHNGNGTSALVRFEQTNTNPPANQLCP